MVGTTGSSGGAPSEPMAPPPKRGSSNTKFYAVIVILILIIAAVAVVAATQAGKTKTITKTVYKTASGQTYGTSSTQYGISTASIGSQYQFSITPNGYFDWATVFWGDGTSTTVAGGNATNVTVSHVYSSVGTYGIYYEVNFSASTYTNFNSIFPITVGYTSVGQQTQISPYIALGGLVLNLETNTSHKVLTSGYYSNITQVYAFTPGGNANFNVTAQYPGSNFEYNVINQTVYIYKGTNVVKIIQMPFEFSGAAAYTPVGNNFLNMSSLSTGYYTVDIVSQTAVTNASTGVVMSGIHTTNSYYDIPVASSVGVYTVSAVASGSLTETEIGTGGYKTLDPAIEYDTVSYEIMINTLLPMFSYNGSSTNVTPVLASKLPTVANGQVNTNYNNWTVHATTATAGYTYTYTASVQPYENYTIYIRNNTKWQDGSPVTAYDVYYSFIRTLLFDFGSPGTPGWIQAQSILPGNYFASNTYWNITQNMSYDNTTNSISFHFQSPITPQFFEETFGQTSGAQITSASWLIAHGAGITFSPTGFQDYKAFGNQGDYNTYVQNHVMADGPYQIGYIVPGVETVLTANPNFVSPGTFFPSPTIKTIYISYVQTPTDSYLALKSGQAQLGAIPTSQWNLEQQLENAGIVQNVSFPTLTIFWYTFNANINMKVATGTGIPINMPSDLFISLQARQAWAYAYNYVHYLGKQVGNDIYHVDFAGPYAGMLPAGMLYQQTISDLNVTGVTNGVPYFDMAKATAIWAAFVNSSIGSAMGLSYASGKDLYSATGGTGTPLTIPIWYQQGDPVDQAGATTWATNLQKMIPGSTVSVNPLTFVNALSWEQRGLNPMPVYFLGWAPDYPYPSDYLVPMALPSAGATYPQASGMYVSYFANTSAHPNVPASMLTNQISNLSSMYNDANQTVLNPGQAQHYYQAWNEMLINMTFYTYVQQANTFFIFSTKIPKSYFLSYQENPMTGGGGDPYFNLISYA